MDRPGTLGRRDFVRAASGVAAAAVLPAVGGYRSHPCFAGGEGSAEEMKPIGVGLIGCGGRGGHHLDVIESLKTAGVAVKIAAVCDIYRPRAEKAAAAHGVKAYVSHADLLADPRVDAVCIATTDHTHGYLAIDAVRAGKDVYCEKPLTHWRQFELTQRLRAEVVKSGRVLQVGTQGLSDRAWHQAAAWIAEGAIGQPVVAECGFFRVGDWGERGMPIDDPDARPGPDLNWEAFLGDSPPRDFDVSRFFRWRMYEDYAGGPVTDLFPHSLTPVVMMLSAGLPSIVVATGGKFRYQEREVPDTFNMLIDYPRGMTIAVLGTQANDFASTGQRGSGSQTPVIRGWEGTISFQGDEVVVTPAGGSSKPAKRARVERGESEAEHWKDFLACCRTRKTPESPIDLGYHVQTALQMGMLSLRERKVARFDATAEKIVL